MTENFLEKYKQEGSESSDSGIDDADPITSKPPKEITEVKKEQKKEEPQSAPKARPKKEDTFKPYTFDPRSVIDAISAPKPDQQPKKIETMTTSYTPSAAMSGSMSARGNILVGDKFKYPSTTDNYQMTTIHKVTYTSPPEMSSTFQVPQFNFSSKNSEAYSSFQAENDYKTFIREFDSEFKDQQREVNTISRELLSQLKRLQIIYSDLNNPCTDIGLLRTKLSRELESIQDNINQANKKLSILMNERSNIKDKFCRLRVKNKELKSETKVLEDNIRSYFKI